MAHRGGAIEHLENTFPAFEQCVELGYRYLETDVRVTSDGELVAFHDSTLDRVTDRPGRVEAMPWRDLQGALIGGREPILRLEDLRRSFGSDLPRAVDLLQMHTLMEGRKVDTKALFQAR